MIDTNDIANRFIHHPPPDKRTANAHESVRAACLYLAKHINELLPDGREKSLAITNLEQVMFWANAGIARYSSGDE